MHNQPRISRTHIRPSSETIVPPAPPFADTVARGQLRIDAPRFTGKENGKDIDYFPIQITKDDILRGQERFNIYCTPCHGGSETATE